MAVIALRLPFCGPAETKRPVGGGDFPPALTRRGELTFGFLPLVPDDRIAGDHLRVRLRERPHVLREYADHAEHLFRGRSHPLRRLGQHVDLGAEFLPVLRFF